MLTGTPLTGSGLANVQPFVKMRSLYLNGSTITDNGLKALRSESLETLDLSQTRISDMGLANLGGLPKLANLDLHCVRIDAMGLKALAPCAQLEC